MSDQGGFAEQVDRAFGSNQELVNGIQFTNQYIRSDDQIPDMRNTFLWLPDYKLKQGSPSRIAFKAPDYPGEYVVLFRGQSEEGELIKAQTTFRVR